MAKEQTPPAPEVERETLTTSEGGTVIINPAPDAPAPKENPDAQDARRPAREG